jgi:hypothetical protein
MQSTVSIAADVKPGSLIPVRDRQNEEGSQTVEGGSISALRVVMPLTLPAAALAQVPPGYPRGIYVYSEHLPDDNLILLFSGVTAILDLNDCPHPIDIGLRIQGAPALCDWACGDVVGNAADSTRSQRSHVTIGGVTVPADFDGLIAVGEFLINFTVPSQLADGTHPMSISVNGVSPPPISSNLPYPIVLRNWPLAMRTDP